MKDDNSKIIHEAAKELDGILRGFKSLDHELGLLGQITQLCEPIQKRLEQVYAQKFPKKCNTCKRVFETREDYLRITSSLRQKTAFYSEQFDADRCIHEYRNCVCGSTLLVLSSDRRDLSEQGQARRELFYLCVDKIKSYTSEDEEIIRSLVRKVFRKIIRNMCDISD